MKDKKYFFGWTNFKWLVSEINKIYSNKESYYSKKRIESGIAFVIGQFGMIMFLLEKLPVMTSSDIALWAGIEFGISGYILNRIQKEKTENKD